MTDFLDLIEQAPEACTLPTVERPLRVAEFTDLFATASVTRISPTEATVMLPPDSLPTARDLAARETACCSFFTFTIGATQDHVTMTIEVPDRYADVLTALTNLVGTER